MTRRPCWMLLERSAWCLFAALVLWFSAAPRAAVACGGPDYGDLGVLRPLEGHLSQLTYTEEDWQWSRAQELGFTYPLLASDPKAFAELERFRHDEPTRVSLSNTKLDAAMAAGDLDAAEREARRVLDTWLDLPSLTASQFNRVAERAALLLDVRPSLKSLSKAKRAAYWAGSPQQTSALVERSQLKRRLTRDIPSGWKDQVARLTPKSTFASLRKDKDDWLRNYPKHPLADDVRLWGVRIEFFADDLDAAWDILIDVYQRRPQRAASEMFYLLRTGNHPSALALSRVTDPVLLTALTNRDTLSAGRWDELWKLSETQPRTKWSVNLQERLLHWAAARAKSAALPAQFPASRRAPTTFWAKARAIALAKHGRLTSARQQLERTPADAQQAAMLGGLYLKAKHPERALRLPKLSLDSQRYLVRVALSDAQLRAERERASGELGALVQGELAARARNWKQASQEVRSQARKDAYASAAQLEKTDRLAYASFLAAHHGQLFSSVDPGFLRGLSTHYQGLKRGKERRAIERAMERGDERWRALEVYTAWLEKHPRAANARAVLADADGVYIRMTSSGGSSGFWREHAGTTQLVRRLRAVGKNVRANDP